MKWDVLMFYTSHRRIAGSLSESLFCALPSKCCHGLPLYNLMTDFSPLWKLIRHTRWALHWGSSRGSLATTRKPLDLRWMVVGVSSLHVIPSSLLLWEVTHGQVTHAGIIKLVPLGTHRMVAYALKSLPVGYFSTSCTTDKENYSRRTESWDWDDLKEYSTAPWYGGGWQAQAHSWVWVDLKDKEIYSLSKRAVVLGAWGLTLRALVADEQSIYDTSLELFKAAYSAYVIEPSTFKKIKKLSQACAGIHPSVLLSENRPNRQLAQP